MLYEREEQPYAAMRRGLGVVGSRDREITVNPRDTGLKPRSLYPAQLVLNAGSSAYTRRVPVPPILVAPHRPPTLA